MNVAFRPPTRVVPMAVLTAILTLSIATVGCKEGKVKAPTVPLDRGGYLVQSSAANVLSNLQLAYAERKIEEYRRLFADDFTFVFSPADATGESPTPIHWDLADELSATQHMFTDTLVHRIELTSYILGAPARADSVYYGPRTWKVRVDAAKLQVWIQTPNGEPLIYIVDGTTEVFFFREDATRPASDGKPTWFIFRWEDQPVGEGKTDSKSWGQIKAMYL